MYHFIVGKKFPQCSKQEMERQEAMVTLVLKFLNGACENRQFLGSKQTKKKKWQASWKFLLFDSVFKFKSRVNPPENVFRNSVYIEKLENVPNF